MAPKCNKMRDWLYTRDGERIRWANNCSSHPYQMASPYPTIVYALTASMYPCMFCLLPALTCWRMYMVTALALTVRATAD
jgi:hypothetical protein